MSDTGYEYYLSTKAEHAFKRMREALTHQQWSVITEAIERYSDGRQKSDLVALGIVAQGVLVLDEVRLAVLAEIPEQGAVEATEGQVRSPVIRASEHPSSERRRGLEEAAKVADAVAGDAFETGGSRGTAASIAKAIRSLSAYTPKDGVLQAALPPHLFALASEAESAADKETVDQKREQHFDAPDDCEVWLTFGTLRKIERVFSTISVISALEKENSADSRAGAVAKRSVARSEHLTPSEMAARRMAEQGVQSSEHPSSERRRGLEEAAKIADEYSKATLGCSPMKAARWIAEDIRALIPPSSEGGSGAVAPPFEQGRAAPSALDAEVLREVLFEMLEADDATLAFLLSVDPAKIGEAEWDRRNKACRKRKEKARESAIAALGGRT